MGTGNFVIVVPVLYFSGDCSYVDEAHHQIQPCTQQQWCCPASSLQQQQQQQRGGDQQLAQQPSEANQEEDDDDATSVEPALDFEGFMEEVNFVRRDGVNGDSDGVAGGEASGTGGGGGRAESQ
ncbi:hypothetical protein Pcinc_015564 [Petrolisthes cinctipes]|uniref:Uncharacterized protein n=1 Tax=Petrolisthes cinctipes TaxID=88211 RepID=A0AAE1KN04_PETCI|nr:hypothetical protein Pcinc_020101 [Petrolisthes cinctipes]KAK3879921.1 hypothetical protein Pcinc_015564 [Petrolisthes cinctipes]